MLSLHVLRAGSVSGVLSSRSRIGCENFVCWLLHGALLDVPTTHDYRKIGSIEPSMPIFSKIFYHPFFLCSLRHFWGVVFLLSLSLPGTVATSIPGIPTSSTLGKSAWGLRRSPLLREDICKVTESAGCSENEGTGARIPVTGVSGYILTENAFPVGS